MIKPHLLYKEGDRVVMVGPNGEPRRPYQLGTITETLRACVTVLWDDGEETTWISYTVIAPMNEDIAKVVLAQ